MNATKKLVAIAVIGGVSLIASLSILPIIAEREGRADEARKEISANWGDAQTIAGPMIVFSDSGGAGGETTETFVLPSTLIYEATLVPEMRSLGIFETAVYRSVISVRGEFLSEEIRSAFTRKRDATLVVLLSDTQGIEKETSLTWAGKEIPFSPGTGISPKGQRTHAFSGIHVPISLEPGAKSIPFSFVLELRGTESLAVAPVGNMTSLSMASTWKTPKFIGGVLPGERTIGTKGFDAKWSMSSLGRTYPQVWKDDVVDLDQVFDSAVGVKLHRAIDAYDLVLRSVKYSILFIVLTFAAFFLFDMLAGVRVHPIQYLLVGAALALFYLLLLSLSEHIAFEKAYGVATGMVMALVGAYSISVLRSVRRALPIIALLALLYGYLYFVLKLEDLALLFGAFLLFIALATMMYATRHIDWYAIDEGK